ncbi:alpha-tocopherol transfer protein-like [Zophobas morio]|uniref:alpha-tocopherol transfer protein-like n=1 Tax=Zophobas morio TaxID=2755281 RepID=UPI003082E990
MNLMLPTHEQYLYLCKENNDDPKTRDRDLESIKEWLRQEPHLPDAFGDKAILNFLRWGKFSLEKTKKRMDMYFTIRSAFPHLFTNRDISNPELKSNHDYFLFAVLPFMTDKARRITVVSAPRDDFQSEDLVNFGKIVFMISDIRLHLEEGALDTYIIDASIIQIKHFPKVPVSAIKDFLVSALEGYPVRVKEVHVVNASTVVSLVLKWASHFIKDKIIRRIQIHENLESLHKCIPKEYLPEEFGGTAGKLIDFSKQWILTLEERKQWFKEQEKLKADESKRVVVGTNRNNIFGVEGSFRQLMID